MSTICEIKNQDDLIPCYINEAFENKETEIDIIGNNIELYDFKLGASNSRKPDYFEMESIRRRLKDLLDFIDPLPINTYYLTDAKRCIVLTKKENGLEIDTSLYYKKEEE